MFVTFLINKWLKFSSLYIFVDHLKTINGSSRGGEYRSFTKINKSLLFNGIHSWCFENKLCPIFFQVLLKDTFDISSKYFSASPIPVAREEPEKIKKWREEQVKRLEEKGIQIYFAI